jgi:hypothetical protein
VAVVKKHEPNARGTNDEQHQRYKLHPDGRGCGVDTGKTLGCTDLNVNASAKRQDQPDITVKRRLDKVKKCCKVSKAKAVGVSASTTVEKES